MPADELSHFKCVNKEFNKVLERPTAWKDLYIAHFKREPMFAGDYKEQYQTELAYQNYISFQNPNAFALTYLYYKILLKNADKSWIDFYFAVIDPELNQEKHLLNILESESQRERFWNPFLLGYFLDCFTNKLPQPHHITSKLQSLLYRKETNKKIKKENYFVRCILWNYSTSQHEQSLLKEMIAKSYFELLSSKNLTSIDDLAITIFVLRSLQIMPCIKNYETRINLHGNPNDGYEFFGILNEDDPYLPFFLSDPIFGKQLILWSREQYFVGKINYPFYKHIFEFILAVANDSTILDDLKKVGFPGFDSTVIDLFCNFEIKYLNQFPDKYERVCATAKNSQSKLISHRRTI